MKINILQYVVSNTNSGLTNYILKNYNFINKSKFNFGFLTYSEILDFEDEYLRLGAKFHRISRPSNIFKFYKEIKQIMYEYNYDIIHINLSYNIFFILPIAKLVGFKKL